jgi:hypothetical protein
MISNIRFMLNYVSEEKLIEWLPGKGTQQWGSNDRSKSKVFQERPIFACYHCTLLISLNIYIRKASIYTCFALKRGQNYQKACRARILFPIEIVRLKCHPQG